MGLNRDLWCGFKLQVLKLTRIKNKLNCKINEVLNYFLSVSFYLMFLKKLKLFSENQFDRFEFFDRENNFREIDILNDKMNIS